MWEPKIGMKVVYIGSDRNFDPNPGKTVHTIQAIKQGCCVVLIDVGIGINNIWQCSHCGKIDDPKTWWKNIEVFRPIIDDYTEEEIEAVNIDELVEPEMQDA